MLVLSCVWVLISSAPSTFSKYESCVCWNYIYIESLRLQTFLHSLTHLASTPASRACHLAPLIKAKKEARNEWRNEGRNERRKEGKEWRGICVFWQCAMGEYDNMLFTLGGLTRYYLYTSLILAVVLVCARVCVWCAIAQYSCCAWISSFSPFNFVEFHFCAMLCVWLCFVSTGSIYSQSCVAGFLLVSHQHQAWGERRVYQMLFFLCKTLCCSCFG